MEIESKTSVSGCQALWCFSYRMCLHFSQTAAHMIHWNSSITKAYKVLSKPISNKYASNPLHVLRHFPEHSVEYWLLRRVIPTNNFKNYSKIECLETSCYFYVWETNCYVYRPKELYVRLDSLESSLWEQKLRTRGLLEGILGRSTSKKSERGSIGQRGSESHLKGSLGTGFILSELSSIAVGGLELGSHVLRASLKEGCSCNPLAVIANSVWGPPPPGENLRGAL